MPTWGASIKSGLGGTYSYRMVGKSPLVRESNATSNVGVDVIPGEVKTTQLPVFLFYNVVMTQGGGCCIIGYHSAFQASAGVQTYATTDYVEKGLFSGPLTDVYAASHEAGEWINDPFVNNATPAWGHVGQVSGCQNNLEVGDPLSGTKAVSVKMPNGVTYHNQELAFRDWFYRTKSVGLNGWFSSRGTFKKNAGPACT